jgi:hypothetical protein
LASPVLAAPPSLTIYNQNFAVVRDTVPLNLQPGTNLIRFDGCAAFLEPSSVVLRDPAAKHAFQILEQNFRYDSVSQEKLLELNEGKVISFEQSSSEGGPVRREIVSGKIVRSGPLPLIEMNGSLRFGLPGQPLFPALGDNTILKPTLVWLENRNVWVFREFTNSAANQLGVPLPKGTLRLYRRDSDGQLEFTGESTIKHTPRDEPVRLFTGNSFDLVGRRRQTDFKARFSGMGVDPTTGLPVPPSSEPPSMDESFEITLRNHKRETVQVRVVEHLYRWFNWQIRQPSQPFEKTDAQTVEFLVELKPDAEQKISYTVHYWW